MGRAHGTVRGTRAISPHQQKTGAAQLETVKLRENLKKLRRSPWQNRNISSPSESWRKVEVLYRVRLGSSILRLICETIQLLFLAAGDQVTGDQRFLTRSHYFSKTASENVSKVSVHLHSLQKNYWRPKIENKWEAPKLRKRNLLSHHHHHYTQFQLQNQRNLVKTQIRNQSNHIASSANIRDLVESWFL